MKEASKPEIDIFQHRLVPKARILNEDEVKALLEKYKIEKRQLPKILVSDPMAKALGAKPGDVLEIERNSYTAGKALYYRVVVSE